MTNCCRPVSYTHLDVYKRQAHLKEHVAEMKAIFQREYFAAAPELSVRMEKTEAEDVLICGDKEKVVKIIDLFPNGIVKMNGAIPGVVESSNNVGTVELGAGKLFITAETRAAYMTTVRDVLDKVDSLAEIFGAEVTLSLIHISTLVLGWPAFFMWLIAWTIAGVITMIINYRLDCKADAKRLRKS